MRTLMRSYIDRSFFYNTLKAIQLSVLLHILTDLSIYYYDYNCFQTFYVHRNKTINYKGFYSSISLK